MLWYPLPNRFWRSESATLNCRDYLTPQDAEIGDTAHLPRTQRPFLAVSLLIMLASVLPGRAVLERGAYITPASRHGGHHQGHHGRRRVVRYAYRTGRTGAAEQLCTRPGLRGRLNPCVSQLSPRWIPKTTDRSVVWKC